MALKVIGLVGMQGSGKTEVVKALAEFDVPNVRMGDVVWGELKKKGMEITEENVAEVANEFRNKDGLGAIAKRCISLIKDKGKGKKAVLVDGIRGFAEVQEFRKKFGKDFSLIAVQASEETRYSRITSRVREDDAKGIQKFREKDRRELGWGMGLAMSSADFTIVNEKGVKELKAESEKIFRKVMGEDERETEDEEEGETEATD